MKGFFSLCCHVQTGSEAHAASYSGGTGALFKGVKWPGHEAEHLHPSSAKVKTAWSYASVPPCLHSVVLN